MVADRTNRRLKSRRLGRAARAKLSTEIPLGAGANGLPDCARQSCARVLLEQQRVGSVCEPTGPFLRRGVKSEQDDRDVGGSGPQRFEDRGTSPAGLQDLDVQDDGVSPRIGERRQ